MSGARHDPWGQSSEVEAEPRLIRRDIGNEAPHFQSLPYHAPGAGSYLVYGRAVRDQMPTDADMTHSEVRSTSKQGTAMHDVLRESVVVRRPSISTQTCVR